MLEHQVGPRAVEDRVEAAQDHRMVEPVKHRCLVAQTRERVRVVYQMRADELGDDDRVQVLVEGEVGLVRVAAPEALERAAAGDDLVALGEPPAGSVLGSAAVIGHRVSDRRVRAGPSAPPAALGRVTRFSAVRSGFRSRCRRSRCCWGLFPAWSPSPFAVVIAPVPGTAVAVVATVAGTGSGRGVVGRGVARTGADGGIAAYRCRTGMRARVVVIVVVAAAAGAGVVLVVAARTRAAVAMGDHLFTAVGGRRDHADGAEHHRREQHQRERELTRLRSVGWVVCISILSSIAYPQRVGIPASPCWNTTTAPLYGRKPGSAAPALRRLGTSGRRPALRPAGAFDARTGLG